MKENYNYLAEVLRSLGQNETAAANYRKAIELDADYLDARINLTYLNQDAASLEKIISAHPDNAMVKLGINAYVNLMELYIRYYQPDVVVFITDIYGWFVRWSRLRSFRDFVENYTENLLGDTIVATGDIVKTKILVCKRPDRRGTSHQRVKEMAETVVKHIMDNKR